MKRLACLVVAAAAPLAGCTIVTPGGGNDSGVQIIVVPPDALPAPPPLHASVLYVANLQRSSANLSAQYASIMTAFDVYLAARGLQIDSMGLIPTYADQFGPRLLLGQVNNPNSIPPVSLIDLLMTLPDAGAQDYAALLPYIGGALGNIATPDLQVALKLLAASGQFDGNGETSEAKNVIEFGRGIGTNALPPELGGIDRNALFDRPRDLFIVVYLQPLPRRCALDSPACQVDGRAPEDIFSEAGPDGSATWLSFASGSMPVGQVVHVAIATSEGEDLNAFRARCAAIDGFPLNVFDMIAPSPNAYFNPLTASLEAAHSGTGHFADFCTLIGGSPEDAIKALGNSVAAVAHTTTPPPMPPFPPTPLPLGAM
jgi:hypothetical protein